MVLENKLNITDSAELARVEEKISKAKAMELFEKKLLDTFEVGTFSGLKKIHSYLFGDIYNFAGNMRTVNIAKGNFRFAPVMYLEAALKNIDNMPQSRIWLACILKKELHKVIDWSKVDKEDYLLAMERSPINLLDMGFSVVQVADWLGHSSSATTLNFYAHAEKRSKMDIANALEAEFQKQSVR